MKRVHIVVVPRERFGASERAIASVYEHTRHPFELLCVDGGSPDHVASALEAQSQQLGYERIRTESFLTPNQARNLGAEKIDAEYVVFLDNDVVVAPGWLERLVRCADETGADVAGPLYCIGEPLHRQIHMAGGEAHFAHRNGKRRFVENHLHGWRLREDVEPELERSRCGHQEFHCMLVRRSALERHGPFDESLLTITETQIDFCLRVRLAGGEVWFEPASVVTHLRPPPFERGDLPYFLWRWNDAFIEAGLARFAQRWGIERGDPYPQRRRRWAASHRLRVVLPLWRALGTVASERRWRLAPMLSRGIDPIAAAMLRVPLSTVRPQVPV